MIQINHVSKHFGEKKALDDITMELPDTGFVLLMGENGSGKSTLLNTIGTLDSPNSGTIVIDEEEMTGKNENELCKYREQNIGIIFQDDNLFENMTARENINIMGESSSFAQIAESLHIEDVLDKKVKLLSGGERQRVAIARALNKKPKTILADEPTSAIDSNSKSLILEIFKTISKESLVIMITHDTETINYADRVIELSEGKVKKIDVINETPKANPISSYKNRFNSIKFAFSQLFTNKKQLIRSCILLIVSFVFILLATSISSINILDMHADTMHLENDHLVVFHKREHSTFEKNEFDDSSLHFLNSNKKSEKDLLLGKSINNPVSIPHFKILYNDSSDYYNYYTLKIDSLTFYSIDTLEEIEYGRKPAKTNEIVINSYIADQIIKYGVILSNGEEYHPKSYEEIVTDDVSLELGEIEVRIAGIKELHLEKFEKLKETNEKISLYDLFAETIKNLGDTVYILDDFYDLFSDENVSLNPIYKFSTTQYVGEDGGFSSFSHDYLKIFNNSVILVNDGIYENLNRGEVLIGTLQAEMLRLNPNNCIGTNLKIYVRTSSNSETIPLDLTIKGITEDNNMYFNFEDVQDFITKKISTKKILLFESDKSTIKNIFNSFPQEYNNSEYFVTTNCTFIYDDVEKICNTMAKLFFFISLALMSLSFIYLINMILDIIQKHMKEIAILKSIGLNNMKITSSFCVLLLTIISQSYLYSALTFMLIRLIVNMTVSATINFKVNVCPINIFLLVEIFVIVLIICMLVILYSFKRIKKTKPQLLFKKTQI